MAIKDVLSRCWILALIIRDDGQRLLLGDGHYEFKSSLQHFAANTFENDITEVHGNDGILLAGQARRPSTQVFEGYIGDGTLSKTEIEQIRRDFFMFFRKNYYYTVVYIFPDGSAIQRRNGFIVDAPEVKEMWQIHPEYHVGLNFEDVNYYAYDEDAQGEEIYGKRVSIPSGEAAKGGLVWDERGVVWHTLSDDDAGAEWEAGTGGDDVIVSIDSIDTVYPVWIVTGRAETPTLTNVTTGTSLVYNGNVTASQTLRIDMRNKTATLNGTAVLGSVTGDWVSFAPGNNKVSYSTGNGDAPASTIEWQEILG